MIGKFLGVQFMDQIQSGILGKCLGFVDTHYAMVSSKFINQLLLTSEESSH